MKMNVFEKKINSTIAFYTEELQGLRTGVANVSLVENIKLSPYENTSPLTIKELATISIPSVKQIVIEPWDKSTIDYIVSAIKSSELSLNPAVSGESIIINLPELTQEQREKYVKIAKKKLEDAKISLRNIRQDMLKSLLDQQKNGVISEDEEKRLKKIVDSKIKEATQKLQELFEKKEKELLSL